MNSANEVAIYLAANNAALRIGKNLFVGDAPGATKNCVILTNTGGSQADQECLERYPTFQVLVRSELKEYDWGYDMAFAILRLLDRKYNLNMGALLVMKCAPIQDPAEIGKDEMQRWRFVNNYQLTLRDDGN